MEWQLPGEGERLVRAGGGGNSWRSAGVLVRRTAHVVGPRKGLSRAGQSKGCKDSFLKGQR